MLLYLVINNENDPWVLDICHTRKEAEIKAEETMRRFEEVRDEECVFIDIEVIDTDAECIWTYESNKNKMDAY